jgi:cell wall-associated NlpC family hydrolase
MRLPTRALGLATALAVAGTLVVGQSAQAQPSLSQARAKAADLRHQLNHLQVQQSVAIERYDGIESDLQQAVSTELTNGDQAQADAQQAQDARDAITDRARALYMSGGQLGLVATVLSGTSPSDVLERAQTMTSVIGSADRAAAAVQADAVHSATVASASTVTRQRVASLKLAAAASLQTVQVLLTRQQTLIHQADRTVVRLAAEQERAAEAAAVARAATSAGAAGIPVGDSGSLPSTIAGPNPAATAAIAAARTRLGLAYLWGATGPNRFDCSGLMQWSYAQAGVTLPRTSRAQYAGLPHVALSDLQPGDLVFYATNTANPATIHHVAMYLGAGLVIHAPHTGDVVRYAPVAMPGLIGAARPTL